ncbi:MULTISPECIES: ABC transporter permease [unclassified Microbacterium]|uniref:ABC transporter permease n=1 Tax=unclassified Microbacterium TaxID=2609290 RepID=UPI00097F4C7C|nr:ABC transporter permease subunit [Microbacterium sp. JB110]RCS62821.1 ABC transporter permease subunit [Microbacterium sp. JB110]SJM62360.1 L-proline glycine betaine ABC transport system permease protein ProW (TC 3.A.1.12.1) [Frigoribacterium sp. JB110]
MDWFPRIELGKWVATGIDWIKDSLGGLLDLLSSVSETLVGGFADLLVMPAAWVIVVLFAFLSWLLRSWKFAITVLVMFLLVVGLDQWEETMQTLSLVVVSAVLAVIVAIPVGIFAARNRFVSAIVKPILDLMQTMPVFVYLIPAIVFFGLGAGPAVFATFLFSIAPGVRMTELGIRGVDSETVEAATAFGAPNRNILFGVQLPLAMPTIMAGVNQVIMLALSMAVVAGMVGADGLGKSVTAAISQNNVALGVEAGLCVVLLAVFLDRLTAAVGTPKDYPSSLIRIIQMSRQPAA